MSLSTPSRSYYSITYFLPNFTESGEDYETSGLLVKHNGEPIAEDNRPPSQPSLLSAQFILLQMVQERRCSSGAMFLRRMWKPNAFTARTNLCIHFVKRCRRVEGVLEGINSYEVRLKVLGFSYYCVVTVDATGVINTDTTGDSCTNAIEENAFTDGSPNRPTSMPSSSATAPPVSERPVGC